MLGEDDLKAIEWWLRDRIHIGEEAILEIEQGKFLRVEPVEVFKGFDEYNEDLQVWETVGIKVKLNNDLIANGKLENSEEIVKEVISYLKSL